LPDRQPWLPRVVGRLSLVQVFTTAAGLVTGPLLARSLGADGRGVFAAIVVPITLAPFVAGFGLGTFATREIARGRSVAVVVGSTGLPLALIALGGVLAAPAIAKGLANGRETVETYVQLGLYALPIYLLSGLLMNVAQGLQRWRMVAYAQALQPLVLLVGVSTLFAISELTVATASVLTIASGFAPLALLLPLGIRAGRPTFSASLAAEGLRFGPKAWFGGIASLTNARLDQLLMIRMVSPSTLGLYAVAVNVASAPTIIPSAAASAIFPRVAAGERALAPRAVRTSIGITAVISATMAALTIPLLHVLYGGAFRGSATMIWILLVGTLPLAGSLVLSSALTSGGHPEASARSEGLALLITIPGLLLLIPPLGGQGAALVSVLSYAASFGYLLTRGRLVFGASLKDLLVPQWADVIRVTSAIAHWRAGHRRLGRALE
jgi:O-antigen/teichoic acid export membrane protein